MCDHRPNVFGYRFLADEWLPDGLQVKESAVLAQTLAENGVAYISTMGGTYESFYLPEVVKNSKKPAFCPRWSKEKRSV